MEVALEKPVAVKDEKREVDDQVVGEIGKFESETSPTHSKSSSKTPSPSRRDSGIIKQEDQLESTKKEMGEVREENERLKMMLAKVVQDYQSLRMYFFDIVQQEESREVINPPCIPIDEEESELISLSLGKSSSVRKKEEKTNKSKSKENEQIEQGLALGLHCKFEGSSSCTDEPQGNASMDNSLEEATEGNPTERWPPSKMLNNLRSGEDEVSQQTHVKRARVSVRARCDAPTMNDGCQWRKYGQKIAKGNPRPRAYYRCTVAPACPVRKQVQRCAEDPSILITTYEGTHNHPLPVSATAMASTTAAAASMLTSGPSTSCIATGSPISYSPATGARLHGMNFGLSDNSRPTTQFYLPNSSISSSASYPTITLDLTTHPPSTSKPSQFPGLSSSFAGTPRYSATSFSFSSSEPNNGYNSSYGSQTYNRGQTGSLIRPFQDSFYKAHATQNSLTDTISKAISSDPSFQSVLAAAITSYVGAHGGQGGSEHVVPVQPYAAANGCVSSYLTRSNSASSNLQQGNLLFAQPPLAYSGSKSTSASPVDDTQNIN